MTNNKRLLVRGFSIQANSEQTKFMIHIKVIGKRQTGLSSNEDWEEYNIFDVTKTEMYELAQQIIELGNQMDYEDSEVR